MIILHNFLFLIKNFLLLRLNLLCHLFIIDNNPAIMTQPLVINIQKLFMDHAYLPIGNAEALSIDETLDGSHLIQENDVVILYLEVDGVEVTVKKFVF